MNIGIRKRKKMATQSTISSVISGTVVYHFSRKFLEKYFKEALDVFQKLLAVETWYFKNNKWTRDKDLFVSSVRPTTGTIINGDVVPFKDKLQISFEQKMPKFDPQIFQLLYAIYEASSPSEIKIDPNASVVTAVQYLLGDHNSIVNTRIDQTVKEALRKEIEIKTNKKEWPNFESLIRQLKQDGAEQALTDLKIENPLILTLDNRTKFLNEVFTTNTSEKNLKTIGQHVEAHAAKIREKNKKILELEDKIRNLQEGDILKEVLKIKNFGVSYSLEHCKNIPIDQSLNTFVTRYYADMIKEIFGVLLIIKPQKINITTTMNSHSLLYSLTQLTTLIDTVNLYKFA